MIDLLDVVEDLCKAEAKLYNDRIKKTEERETISLGEDDRAWRYEYEHQQGESKEEQFYE